MEKICYDCADYCRGQLENPCQRGNRHVGYLKENMRCWEARDKDSPETTFTRNRNKRR